MHGLRDSLQVTGPAEMRASQEHRGVGPTVSRANRQIARIEKPAQKTIRQRQRRCSKQPGGAPCRPRWRLQAAPRSSRSMPAVRRRTCSSTRTRAKARVAGRGRAVGVLGAGRETGPPERRPRSPGGKTPLHCDIRCSDEVWGVVLPEFVLSHLQSEETTQRLRRRASAII